MSVRSCLGPEATRDGMGSMLEEAIGRTTSEALSSAGSRTRSQCDDEAPGRDDDMFRDRRGTASKNEMRSRGLWWVRFKRSNFHRPDRCGEESRRNGHDCRLGAPCPDSFAVVSWLGHPAPVSATRRLLMSVGDNYFYFQTLTPLARPGL